MPNAANSQLAGGGGVAAPLIASGGPGIRGNQLTVSEWSSNGSVATRGVGCLKTMVAEYAFGGVQHDELRVEGQVYPSSGHRTALDRFIKHGGYTDGDRPQFPTRFVGNTTGFYISIQRSMPKPVSQLRHLFA